ncbi:HlyD family efflux transporter periplasmic adaptor subunit [Pedobacter sp. UYP1]|uniref:HlyD family secretion protein n=1 Tax=Pedobacter sp. UYP1 TaxID=1756396 RepID=UPI00339184D3
MNEEEIYHSNQRTEQVQDIIERMPIRFGFWVSLIVLFIFIMLLLFGWLVRYPDVVTGQIVINANNAPLKLIANNSGKLKLNGVKSMDQIKEGQVIAYIENPTRLENVLLIERILKDYNPNADTITRVFAKLPPNFSMGDLNIKYYSFVNSLQNYINYRDNKLMDKQDSNLRILQSEQRNAITSAEKRVEMSINNLKYVYKSYWRDSLLFIKKVISESEFDKTNLSYIAAKDGYQFSLNNMINAKQSEQQTGGKRQELSVQKPEKQIELRMAVISAFNDLQDNIKSWEQKYIFRSPFSGKVQFLKFYTDDQFITSGEPVFTIVAKEEKALGQVSLPAIGSGKIKIGQEVIVKLDNFPYMEYGSIKGRVNSISLTTNITKTENSNIDTYMVLVDFPDQLKTNYGKELDFRAEAKGTAEIITNDRRLVQRFFDNLKYVLNK